MAKKKKKKNGKLKTINDAKQTGSLLSEKLLCNEVIEDFKIVSVTKV